MEEDRAKNQPTTYRKHVKTSQIKYDWDGGIFSRQFLVQLDMGNALPGGEDKRRWNYD